MKDNNPGDSPIDDIDHPDSFKTAEVLGDILSECGCIGDPKVELNSVATLSLAAAHLASPILHGGREPEGVHLFSCDPVLNEAARRAIVGPIRSAQNHEQRMIDQIKAAAEYGISANSPESVAPSSEQEFGMLYCGGGDLLTTLSKIERYKNPKLLVSGSSLDVMERQAGQIHLSSAVCVPTITSARQAQELSPLLSALQHDGYQVTRDDGSFGTSTTGVVIALADPEVGKSVATSTTPVRWADDCLWMDEKGADLKIKSANGRGQTLRRNLSSLCKKRFHHRKESILAESPTEGYQQKWLEGLETWTGGDRNQMALGHKLFTALGYGLIATRTATPYYSTKAWLWAFHLGKYLLMQSRAVRERMKRGAELARIQQAANRVLPKMTPEPMKVRQISRLCSSMKAELCRAALLYLEQSSCLIRVDDTWRLNPESDVFAENANSFPLLNGAPLIENTTARHNDIMTNVTVGDTSMTTIDAAVTR